MSKWEFKKLGKLITLQRGFDITKSQQNEGIYPVISSGGTGSFHNEYKANGPGVVIGRKGTLGTVFYTESNYWPHSTALWVKDFQGNHPRYIYYFLKTLDLKKLDSGSSNPTLNRNFAHDLDISCPCPLEQQKIADVLSALDQKIEINNRINAELEAMAKTLYDYWFVQFDFPDENGKPYKSSGGKMLYSKELKREIPAEWEVKELYQIANITMGQSPEGSSYNEAGKGTVFFQGSTDFGMRFPNIRQYTTEPSRLAKAGDILLSVRAPVGTMNIADIDCCIGRGLAALNSKDGFDAYLFYVMKYFKRLFDRRNSEGTTFGSITKNDLFSLQVAYPDKLLLKSYDDVIAENNKLVLNNQQENQRLATLRDWLLPMLMNGQVRVESAADDLYSPEQDAGTRQV